MPLPKPLLPIVGVGAGGHAVSVLEAIRSGGRFEVIALVDDEPSRAGSTLLGFPVAGANELESQRAAGVAHAFVGVGGVGDASARRRVFARLLADGFELPAIVHTAAAVSPWARLGPGVQVLAGAVVNAGVSVEEGAIVNTGAVVEHDCRIGAYAHVGPGALLAGDAAVGEGAHVGIGAVVIEQVKIGSEALVAAGAVVTRDVPEGVRVAGVPARTMRS